jgi:ATPase subunit of ABC transporter with duplicated ATPase domains
MLLKDNVLLLDEPTNHLDLESISAMGDGLAKYEGTALVATHDRDMVQTFANRIIHLSPSGEIINFQGTYDEFAAKYPDV